MSDKCGNCGSSNLDDHIEPILWQYARICLDCGTRTQYTSKGNVCNVEKNYIKVEKKKNPFFTYPYKGSLDSYRNLKDNSGKFTGSIDSFGNIKDSSGKITGSIDSFGNIKDNSGKITGSIDSFGNIRK